MASQLLQLEVDKRINLEVKSDVLLQCSTAKINLSNNQLAVLLTNSKIPKLVSMSVTLCDVSLLHNEGERRNINNLSTNANMGKYS